MEPGQDSERFDVLGYLIIYWWLAMRTSTSLDRANDSVGDMMMMCNLESKVSRLLWTNYNSLVMLISRKSGPFCATSRAWRWLCFGLLKMRQKWKPEIAGQRQRSGFDVPAIKSNKRETLTLNSVDEVRGDWHWGWSFGPMRFHAWEAPQPVQSQRKHGVRGKQCRCSLDPTADCTLSRGGDVEGSLRNTTC